MASSALDPIVPIELSTNGRVDEHDEVEGQDVPDTISSYPTGIRFVLLTLGLIFTVFLSALDTSILSTAIPAITDEFGTVKDVGWYGAAYTITNAAFISTWGKAVGHIEPGAGALLTV
jgi:MFS transporter, DHA2 family, glioxin efflux transporter